MNIHAFETGRMAVKNNYYAARGKSRTARLTSVLLDREFHPPLPVYTWAIEHPEGVIVIDTGLNAGMAKADYFPLVQRPYWNTQYRFFVTEDDEIGPQLRRVGIQPNDVRWVVLTHAHFDHTGGLEHFPKSEIIFARKEYEDVQRFRSAHFDLPSKWPTWLKPRLIDYNSERVGPFTMSYPLTQAGDVRLIPTPGHTAHHQSVILEQDGMVYFFAGDTSFDLGSLMLGTLDAPAWDRVEDLQTRRRILHYAEDRPLVYLPTHDDGSANRLAEHISLHLENVTLTQ
jgi:N-acyl homoserine lactone hydrolase